MLISYRGAISFSGLWQLAVVTGDCQLFSGGLEAGALIGVAYKPFCWFWYIDNTFVFWAMNHKTVDHHNIQFTSPAFILISAESYSLQEGQWPQPLFECQVAPAIQRTGILHFPPWHTESVPSVPRDPPCRKLDILQWTFRQNGYSNQSIYHALNPPQKVKPLREVSTSVTVLPFVGTTFNCISRMLSKYNIKTGHIDMIIWEEKSSFQPNNAKERSTSP